MGKGAEGEEADDVGDEDEDAWVECVFFLLAPGVIADGDGKRGGCIDGGGWRSAD